MWGDSTSLYPQETTMKLALIGAAAVAAAAFTTPALAQAVIEDPGYCAQFYPDANCQNLGPGNPYTDGGYYRGWQNGFAMMPNHATRTTRPHRHAEPDRYRGGPKEDEWRLCFMHGLCTGVSRTQRRKRVHAGLRRAMA
jgi:hypothetical protein